MSELAGAAKIGMELRAVRMRLGWQLDDVAAELRIQRPYLEAIEAGELSVMPGPAYQSGFVRAYAKALGLDGDEILRRFRAAGSGAEQKPALSFLAPVPDRAVPTGAIILVGVSLVLLGYGLWYRHTAHEARLAAEVPSVPAELAPLAVPPKPPVAIPPQPQAPAPPAAAAVPAVAAAPAPPAKPAVGAPPGLTIMATGDDWVEVKDENGNILFSKTLHAGDSWPVPELPGLKMTAGNAGATELAGNGKTGSPLGAAGSVIRDYVLTPPSQAASQPAASQPAASQVGTPPAAAK